MIYLISTYLIIGVSIWRIMGELDPDGHNLFWLPLTMLGWLPALLILAWLSPLYRKMVG